MSMYKVVMLPFFERATKKLKKKYKRISKDLLPLVQQLKQGFFEGDKLQGFEGKHVYKVRVPSTDQKKGKSGGFRVLYYAVTDDNQVFLLFIYAKSLQSNPTPKQIKELKQAIEELT